MSAEEIKYPTLSVTVAPISTKDPRREKERTENDKIITNSSLPHKAKDYFVYFFCTIFIVMPVIPELYSNYYKLIKINEASSDFKGPHMSKDIMYGLLSIALIFAIYMLIVNNIKTLYKSWSHGGDTKDLLNAFNAYILEGLGFKKNSDNEWKFKEKRNMVFRILATLLVLGNTGFYVTSTAKGSYKDLINDFGCSRSGAKAFAFFAMIGAGVGGTYYALRKTQDTLPNLLKIISGKIQYKKEKEKTRKKFLLVGVMGINLTSSLFYYQFSLHALSSVPLAILHTIFLTTVVSLISIHGIYKDEIKTENSDKGVNNTQNSDPKELAKKRWKKYTPLQKFSFIIALIICALISLTNLLATALSAATGWKTELTKWIPSIGTDTLPLFIAFCGAAIALSIGRYYFAHVPEQTLEMHNDACSVGETIAAKAKGLKIFDRNDSEIPTPSVQAIKYSATH